MWGWLGVLLFSMMIAVRLDVLLSYYSNDLYSALQAAFEGAGAGNEAVRNSGVHGFWFAIITFALIAAVYISRHMLDIYLMQRFIIRWRVWLTDRLTGDWLDERGLLPRPVHRRPDRQPRPAHPAWTSTSSPPAPAPNRIRPTVGTSTTLLFGAINSMVSVVSFTPILWNLSGPLTPLRLHPDPRAVLDRAALRRVRHGDRVLDRQAADPAELPQRADQRRVPLRAGAAARRRRGDRLLPRRARRTHDPGIAVRGDHRQLPGVRATQPRTCCGWNQVDEPDHRRRCRWWSRRLGCSPARSPSATSPSRRARSLSIHDSLSFFRSVYDSFAGYRATIIRLDGPGRRQRTGAGRCLGWTPRQAPTAQWNCATSRSARPTASSSSTASICGWSPVTRW